LSICTLLSCSGGGAVACVQARLHLEIVSWQIVADLNGDLLILLAGFFSEKLLDVLYFDKRVEKLVVELEASIANRLHIKQVTHVTQKQVAVVLDELVDFADGVLRGVEILDHLYTLQSALDWIANLFSDHAAQLFDVCHLMLLLLQLDNKPLSLD